MQEQKIYEIILMGYPKAIEIKADRHEISERGIDLYVGEDQIASYTSVKGWRIVGDATQEIKVTFVDTDESEVPES